MVSTSSTNDECAEVSLIGRTILFIVLLGASWCVLTTTHEAGHLLGGWLGGGSLRRADFAPWHLPYSIFDPDPRPLLRLWSGPLLGALLPLLAALLVRQQWMWFIAHFVLLGNGLYLAAGWLSGDRFLDTPELLHYGAQPATIAVYCAVTIGIGYIGFRRACIRFFAARDGKSGET